MVDHKENHRDESQIQESSFIWVRKLVGSGQAHSVKEKLHQMFVDNDREHFSQDIAIESRLLQ